MKLNPPRQVTWLLAVLVGLVGILAQLVPIDYVSDYSFWVMAAAWLLLVLATVLRGL